MSPSHDPLTAEEVRVLARHWWEVYLDTRSLCVVTGTRVTAEWLASEHATDRLRAAEAVLGREELARLGEEAEARVRWQANEAAWVEFLGGVAFASSGGVSNDD